MSAQSRERDAAAEQAAAWKDRLARDRSEECRAGFRQWFKQSPINQEQYLIVSGFRRRLELVPVASLVEARETPVLLRLAGAAVAVGLVAGVVVWLLSDRTTVSTDPITTTTLAAPKDPSESIQLGDGSTLQLNGGWARMSTSRRSRELHLYEGDAKVSVSGDSTRPFRLINGPFVIDDVGTEFVASPKDSGIRVLVIHGSVRVTVHCRSGGLTASKTERLWLQQRQEVSLEDNRCASKSVTRTLDQHEIDQRIAWTVGWFHFHDDRLADAAERFNRYNGIQLKVDPAIADRRVSGNFSATNPVGFACAAAKVLGIRVNPAGPHGPQTEVLYLIDSRSESEGGN